MRILEQKRGNMWVGAAHHYYGRIMYYASVLLFPMTAATFWHTTGSTYIQLPLALIILTSCLLLIIIIFIDYTWITPSMVAYQNKLLMEQNPVLNEIRELKEMIKELETLHIK